METPPQTTLAYKFFPFAKQDEDARSPRVNKRVAPSGEGREGGINLVARRATKTRSVPQQGANRECTVVRSSFDSEVSSRTTLPAEESRTPKAQRVYAVFTPSQGPAKKKNGASLGRVLRACVRVRTTSS